MQKLLQNILTSLSLSKGSKRSILAKKNILASVLIKGLSIIVGLLMLPLALDYLNPTTYGVWVTLSSIIGWFGFFDVGLGNGLRNRFAEAKAADNSELARTYVSTTYAILLIIIAGLLAGFYSINPFISWIGILNADPELISATELSFLALLTFTFFCLNLILRLITTILTADQRPAKASFFNLLGHGLALVVIYILTKTTEGSLLYLGIVLSGIPVAVLAISSVWFFAGSYSQYRPSFKFVDFKKSADLLGLGIKFFVLSMTGVIVFSTNNIIITQLFGPEEVARYNVAFKYFSVLLMGFSIVVLPFWSAFTDAWAKQEFKWITNIVRKLLLLWCLMAIVGCAMLAVSPLVYKLWIGDQLTISYLMSGLIMIWFLVKSWNSIFVQFLNGLGKIRLQIYLGILSALFNIPLALYLGKLIGIEGVFLANILVSMITVLIYPTQYRLLMSGKAYGIFNK